MQLVGAIKLEKSPNKSAGKIQIQYLEWIFKKINELGLGTARNKGGTRLASLHPAVRDLVTDNKGTIGVTEYVSTTILSFEDELTQNQ